MTDATPPDDADGPADADEAEAVEATGGGDPRFRPRGDVEGILRADPTEGPDAGQESWVDDDPGRNAGG